MEAERKKGVDFFYSKKNFTWSDRGREAVNTRGRADSNRFYRCLENDPIEGHRIAKPRRIDCEKKNGAEGSSMVVQS